MRTNDRFRWTPTERECFADEIAIDFPSLAAAIERMRAAFFSGEEAAASPPPPVAGPASRFGIRPRP